MPKRKSFRLGTIEKNFKKNKEKTIIQSIRFNKKNLTNEDIKAYLKNNDLIYKVIKYKEDENFIYLKFHHSNKFIKKSFIYFTDINDTKFIRGIFKTDTSVINTAKKIIKIIPQDQKKMIKKIAINNIKKLIKI